MKLIILSLIIGFLFVILLRLLDFDGENSISFGLVIVLISVFFATLFPINGYDIENPEYIKTIDIVACVEEEENYIYWKEKEQYVIDVDNYKPVYIETKIYKENGIILKDLKEYETPFIKIYMIKGKKTEWTYAFFCKKYFYEIHIP